MNCKDSRTELSRTARVSRNVEDVVAHVGCRSEGQHLADFDSRRRMPCKLARFATSARLAQRGCSRAAGARNYTLRLATWIHEELKMTDA